MNQTQRNLLCKMVQEEADKVKAACNNKYPFNAKHGEYRFSRHSWGRASDQAIAALPPEHAKTYKKLEQRCSQLDKEQKKLDTEWDKFEESVEKIRKAAKAKHRRAIERLEAAVRQATLQIQFAENAEDAHRILNSLPSAEQLLE